MERGPGRSIGLDIMQTLTYRGQDYVQHKEASPKQLVELTYRKNVYLNRKEQVSNEHPVLTYRGHRYQK